MKKDYLYNAKDSYTLSYSKLCGKKIKDILGYVSNEFDAPTFKISKIILEDDTEQWVEGEHDIPYLTDYDERTANLLKEINEEEEKENENERN